MKKIEITKIELLTSGEVAVYPSVSSPSYEHVYRAALGVYWDKMAERFHAPHTGYDAKEKTITFWITLIQAAVKDELGIDLVITESTQWINIAEDQKHQITKTE